MKKITTLFILMMTLIWSDSFGQATSYNLFADSTLGCTTSIYVNVNIGANPETGGILTINWGDGLSDNYPFTTSTGNTSSFINCTHGYSVAGNYALSANVYSATAAANVDAGQTQNILAFSPSNCGFIYIYTTQINPSVPYYSVPYDFTDQNGNVTTILQNSNNGQNVYTGLNPGNTYTVSINDAWLLNNGLAQSTADFTITSFNPNGLAVNGQVTMLVNCNVPASNPDFAVSYSWASNFVAPLQSGNLIFSMCNLACSDTSDVTVSIDMPANFVPNTSGLSNATVNGNTLTFDVTGLSECEQIIIPFNFPGNTPAGTSFCFNLTLINPLDSDLSNNIDTVCSVVLNSYDPNDKSVNQPEQINPNVREKLQYVVRFQNDGNFDALDVVVVDTIDANLDLSTFELLGSKHGVATTINPTTRVVTFSFNDINLTPYSQDSAGSQGYVIYSIEENVGLTIGDEIRNTAYIYFDFNPAIITNTTYNINTTLGVNEQSEQLITVYPNPANNNIQFLGGQVQSVQVIDMTGKLVMNQTAISNNSLSVETLSNGIYQVMIQTELGISNQRLIIRK